MRLGMVESGKWGNEGKRVRGAAWDGGLRVGLVWVGGQEGKLSWAVGGLWYGLRIGQRGGRDRRGEEKWPRAWGL